MNDAPKTLFCFVVGVVGLEPTKSNDGRFTVCSRCRWRTPQNRTLLICGCKGNEKKLNAATFAAILRFFCYFLLLPLLPLFHRGFPVCGLSAVYSFLLSRLLVACFVACTLGFHVCNGGVVEYGYCSAFHRFTQFCLTESLALLVEIGDVELIVYALVVAYLLLSCAVACVFKSQQFSYLFYFLCRKLCPSHSFVCFAYCFSCRYVYICNCWRSALLLLSNLSAASTKASCYQHESLLSSA